MRIFTPNRHVSLEKLKFKSCRSINKAHYFYLLYKYS